MPKFNPKTLTDVASEWKSLEPELYEKFLRILDQWTFEVTVAVTEAPASDILVAQGRAQQARKFTQIFIDALEHTRAAP